MKIKTEIEIHHKSEHILKVFDKYKKVDKLPGILTGRTVIHLYPIEDTVNDVELAGFYDVLFFNMVVCNVREKIMFKSKGHDSIEALMPCCIRIFKDLSTMIITDRNINIRLGQCIWIHEIK